MAEFQSLMSAFLVTLRYSRGIVTDANEILSAGELAGGRDVICMCVA